MARPEENIALVLQGGGALGAYQGGAAECILGCGIGLHWVAGISIGAINSAILAGSAPEDRVRNLRRFWERVSSRSIPAYLLDGVLPRGFLNHLSASATSIAGVPGFFDLRVPPAGMMPPGTSGASSYYDTAPLRETLEELVDFDRINHGDVRLSVGAVNVETGNMTWFDSEDMTIGPEHIMASGALPPGFPAVEIDGAFFWDGGIVTNTPLHYVLDERMPHENLCVFQVDLFSARGAIPDSVWDAPERMKDIRFSSRTRFNTDMMRRMHQTSAAARRLYRKLPPELRDDPDARLLGAHNDEPRITIAHLIYRQRRYEHHSKDYEFSRWSMEEHWRAGHHDAETTVKHPDWRGRMDAESMIQVFDLAGK